MCERNDCRQIRDLSGQSVPGVTAVATGDGHRGGKQWGPKGQQHALCGLFSACGHRLLVYDGRDLEDANIGRRQPRFSLLLSHRPCLTFF